MLAVGFCPPCPFPVFLKHSTFDAHSRFVEGRSDAERRTRNVTLPLSGVGATYLELPSVFPFVGFGQSVVEKNASILSDLYASTSPEVRVSWSAPAG